MNVELESKLSERLHKFAGFVRTCDHHQFIFHELDSVLKFIVKLYKEESEKEERARRKRERAKKNEK